MGCTTAVQMEWNLQVCSQAEQSAGHLVCTEDEQIVERLVCSEDELVCTEDEQSAVDSSGTAHSQLPTPENTVSTIILLRLLL